MSSFFSPPSIPNPPPPPPPPQPVFVNQDKSVQDTLQRQRLAAALAQGRESTILTGQTPPGGQRTKLGQS